MGSHLEKAYDELLYNNKEQDELKKDLRELELDEFYAEEKFGPITWDERLAFWLRRNLIIPIKHKIKNSSIFQDDYKNGRTKVRLCGLKFSYINPKLVIRPDYTPVISKIQNKYKNKEKIRVGFLVNENCKWNAEYLYNLLEENEHFEPIILITLYDTRHQKKDMTKSSIEDNYNFFASTGKRVEKVYDEENEKYLAIKDFDIDILFYQQPWGLDDSQSIEETANDSLCCYFAYGISAVECPADVRPFHEKLFAYFIPNEETKTFLESIKINNLDNLNIVGYPKLDIYNNLSKTRQIRKTIIYAPHHSYKRGLKLGTFNKTGMQILEFAKQHKEYNWVFKPHPDLKEVLYKDKKYRKEFTENYYKQWAEIGKVYDKGNYFEQFMQTDILITDCDSFLLEYMPTLNPIIRLERKDSVKLSKLGQEIVKGIYCASNFDECVNILKKLDKPNQDELKEKRKEITDSILRKTTNASANIVAELEKLFTSYGVVNEK